MLVGFQKQFAALVESGEKRQTIRAYRKRPFKTGDKLQLYTGLRTKGCRKLGDAVCSEVLRTTIGEMTAIVDGIFLNDFEIETLAHRDGFGCIEDFFKFFKKGCPLPFNGQLIKWDELI